VATPVHFMVYVQFTNLRDVPMMVGSYAMEMRTTNGNWVEMPSLDMTGGTLYGLLSGNRRAARCEATTFQSALIGKLITPQETVQGWIFLDFPTNGMGSDYRFHIRCTTGAEFTEHFNLDAARHFGAISQSPSILITPDIINVDEIPFE